MGFQLKTNSSIGQKHDASLGFQSEYRNHLRYFKQNLVEGIDYTSDERTKELNRRWRDIPERGKNKETATTLGLEEYRDKVVLPNPGAVVTGVKLDHNGPFQ